ncbi:hypothetical protein N9937_00455 [bacterium]|nr:hypothetical protein [bacterium]
MLYDRKYLLEFGRVYTPSNPEYDINVAEGHTAVFLDQHQIKFKVMRSSSTSLNITEITVYNTSPEVLHYLTIYSDQEILVKLQGGYGDNLTVLTMGTITSLTDSFEGETRETVFTVSDGGSHVKTAVLGQDWFAGTPWEYIMDELIDATFMPRGVVIPPEGQVLYPYYADGSAYSSLKDLATELEYTLNIQNMAINFYPTGTDKLVNVQIIDESSGLIGSPAVVGDTAGNLLGDGKVKSKGVKFKTLLNGTLYPDTIIELRSKEFNGQYQIQTTKHSGNFRGDDWFTECECTEFNTIKPLTTVGRLPDGTAVTVEGEL